MEIAYPAGLANNNQNDFGCNCKSGYTGVLAKVGCIAYSVPKVRLVDI